MHGLGLTKRSRRGTPTRVAVAVALSGALSVLGVLHTAGSQAAAGATTPTATTAGTAITAVGNLSSAAGNGVSTLSVDPQSAGDALVAVVKVLSPTLTVSSLTGGGVASWTLLERFNDGSHDLELWMGTVTAPGPATLGVTYSGSAAGDDVDLDAQEFSAGNASATWTLDAAGGQGNASSTTIQFPSLTASGSGELYFGFARSTGDPSAGSTPGFTYRRTADANIICYATAVSGTAAPQAPVSPASTSSAVGVLVRASLAAAPAPTVTAVSPSSGPAAGGTTVTVTGTNFTGATAVSFGSAAATGVHVLSSTQLSAVAPPGSGTVDVRVTGPGGTSAASSGDQFAYQAPTSAITAVGSPWDHVYGSGGTALAGDPRTAGDVLVVSVDSHYPAALTSVSGGGVTTWNRAVQFVSARGHDIELWYGTITSPGAAQITFSWPSPGVGGYWTEYTAQEFSAALGTRTSWSVDDGQAASVNGPYSTTLPYPTLTPSTAGDLYYGLAGIPNTPLKGSTPGFTYQVDRGANVLCYDTDVASTVAPTAAQRPAGLSELVGALLHASPSATPAVTVSSVKPTSGPATGGTTVTVTGTNFTDATAVSFGTAPAAGVTVVSPSELTAVTPPGAGTVNVRVTGSAGTSIASSGDQFTYTPVIKAAGGLWDHVYASGGTRLAGDARAAGDVLVVSVDSHYPYALTSLSGGGVTTWHRAVQFVSARGHDIELWFGTITSPGTTRIVFTWPSPGPGGYWTELTAREYTAGWGAGTNWVVDGGQVGTVNRPVSTTLPYPTLTPSSSGDLYYGLAGIPNTPVKGSTPGFTYQIDHGENLICFDTHVRSTVSPTAAQQPAGVSELVGALLRPFKS